MLLILKLKQKCSYIFLHNQKYDMENMLQSLQFKLNVIYDGKIYKFPKIYTVINISIN